MPCFARCNPTAISLKAGCELFLRYTTRTSALELEDFSTAKKRLIEVRKLAIAAYTVMCEAMCVPVCGQLGVRSYSLAYCTCVCAAAFECAAGFHSRWALHCA